MSGPTENREVVKAEEQQSRPRKEEEQKTKVVIQGEELKAPFTQTAFLFLLRFLIVIGPFVYGLFLVQKWWNLLYNFRGAFHYDLGFPWWLVWISIAALGVLGTFVWAFVCYDLIRSFQIIGQWQRKNIYRLGKFVRCVESGRLAAKMPLLESWSSTIDMRRRVTRWSANLIMTVDDVLVDLSMTNDYTVNPEHPERSEIEIKDLDQFVQTKAEAVTRSVACRSNLTSLQGGEADEEFRKALQEKVGDLVTIHYMGITDTSYSPETASALASKAVRKAEAEGRREARQIDRETARITLEIAQIFHDRGLNYEPGEVAWALEQYDKQIQMGEKGKGVYVFGAERMLEKIRSGGANEVVQGIRTILGQQTVSKTEDSAEGE